MVVKEHARARGNSFGPKVLFLKLNEWIWRRLQIWMESPGSCALIIAIITFALYARVVSFNYIEFDDPIYTYDNPIVKKGITAEGFQYAFQPFNGLWQPLTMLSFMVETQFFGVRAGISHLTNLWLHIGNSLLLLMLLRTLKFPSLASAFITMVFAWHPANLEAVAWISERKGLLAGFFSLACLIAYCRYALKPSTAKYWTSVGLFVLGCLAKPSPLVVPILLLLVDYWPLKRLLIHFRPQSVNPSSIAGPLAEKIPFFAISMAVTIISLRTERVATSLDWLYRISNAAESYAFYLLRFFAPFNMSIVYPRPPYWAPAGVCIALSVVAILTFLAIRTVSSMPEVFFGWFWFVVGIIPISGLVPCGPQWAAHRYSYIPYIGISIALIGGILPRIRYRCGSFYISFPTLGAIIAAYLIGLTACQLGEWKNSKAAFTQALKNDPDNYLAKINNGKSLALSGRLAEAAELNLDSLADNPVPEALQNLGNIARVQKQYRRAALYFEAAANNNMTNPKLANLAARYLLVSSTTNRDYGERAFACALRACELTTYRKAEFLDTLSCVYAHGGDYLSAIRAAEDGISLAAASGETSTIDALKHHLIDFLRKKQPTLAWDLGKEGRSLHE